MGGGSLKIRTPVHFTISSSCKRRKRIKNMRKRTKKGGNHSTINIGKRIQNIQQFWTIKDFLEFLKKRKFLKSYFWSVSVLVGFHNIYWHHRAVIAPYHVTNISPAPPFSKLKDKGRGLWGLGTKPPPRDKC